jgi:hypothetical protein
MYGGKHVATHIAVAAELLVSKSLLAQEPSTPHSCAASDQALRVVAHDFVLPTTIATRLPWTGFWTIVSYTCPRAATSCRRRRSWRHFVFRREV